MRSVPPSRQRVSSVDLDRMQRHPFLFGTVVLILMSWGCGQGIPGARALPPLPSGVRADVTEIPYTVTGTTVAEIRLSLRTAATATLGSGPVGLHRGRFALRYSYGQNPGSGGCEITDLTIELESAIQVPRWTDRETADSTLVAMWDAYITELRGHEYTHREYLYRRARDISRELYRIERSTCASMESIVNSTIQRVEERYRRLNEEFDEENGIIAWPLREFEAEARQAREPPVAFDPNPTEATKPRSRNQSNTDSSEGVKENGHPQSFGDGRLLV